MIELLVVIIIIGILTAIAIPLFIAQQKRAVDASVKSDLKNIATLQEAYVADFPGVQGLSTMNSGTTWNDASLSSTTGVAVVAPKARVFVKSPGSIIMVMVRSTGYCIRGDNHDDSNQSAWMIYDSANGGLLGFQTWAQIAALPGSACN